MSTPVTAAQVAVNTDVWHDDHLCHITAVKERPNGSLFVEWTEDLFGTEANFGGSFRPDSYFGEKTNI